MRRKSENTEPGDRRPRVTTKRSGNPSQYDENAEKIGFMDERLPTLKISDGSVLGKMRDKPGRTETFGRTGRLTRTRAESDHSSLTFLRLKNELTERRPFSNKTGENDRELSRRRQTKTMARITVKTRTTAPPRPVERDLISMPALLEAGLFSLVPTIR
jgi:hypothetical protein